MKIKNATWPNRWYCANVSFISFTKVIQSQKLVTGSDAISDSNSYKI